MFAKVQISENTTKRKWKFLLHFVEQACLRPEASGAKESEKWKEKREKIAAA